LLTIVKANFPLVNFSPPDYASRLPDKM